MTSPVQYYVDPAINGNSGAGTIGNPFGDLQHALNNITRSTTVGDQINIKSGAPEVQASAISLAAYGTTPTSLTFRGYNTVANDGGRFEINFGGANVNFFSGSPPNISIIDGKLWNNGTGNLTLGTNSYVESCELITSGITTGAAGQFRNCKISVLTQWNGILLAHAGVVIEGCWIESLASNGYAIYQNGTPGIIRNNVVIVRTSNTVGIFLVNGTQAGNFCENNTIVSTVPSTAAGITLRSTWKNAGVICNNLIAGFSGIGGAAIRNDGFNTRNTGAIRTNRFFNCTSGVVTTAADVIVDNLALAESPFFDFANEDFRINETVRGIAYPQSIFGISATSKRVDVGALQSESGSNVIGFTGLRGMSRRLGT